MIKNVSKMAAVAAWLAALPGVAHAGSASAKGSFVFSVVTQCSLKGNDVDLGGFWTTQTWGDVADELGAVNVFNEAPVYGTRGKKYINWGSVTCDKGTLYNIRARGATSSGRIVFTHNGKTIGFLPAVEELGGETGFGVPGEATAGTGKSLYLGFTATGTGAKQDMLGSVFLRFNTFYTSVQRTDVIGGPAQVLTDSITYTLTL